MAQSVRFYGNGVSFCIWPVIFLGSYLVSLRVLSSGACISQPRWIPVQRILGGWQNILCTGISCLPVAPPEYSWFVLVAVPCSLLRLTVVRQLMRVVILVLGQGRWLQFVIPQQFFLDMYYLIIIYPLIIYLNKWPFWLYRRGNCGSIEISNCL